MWRRLRPHYYSDEGKDLARACMIAYAESREWGPEIYKDWWLPKDFDSCSWRCERPSRLAWWRFVCHSACHWVAPVHLRALQLVEPGWSIYCDADHTHCRNGDRVYDPNASALEFDPLEMMPNPTVFTLEDYLEERNYNA